VRIRAGAAAASLVIAGAIVHLTSVSSGLGGRPYAGSVLAAASKPPVPYDVFAGAWIKPDKKAPLPPGVRIVRSNMKGLGVSVEYATPARRAEFLRTLGDAVDDPFAPVAGRRDRVVAFIVSFNNQGREQVVFNPGNVSLITDHNERSFPLDMTDMYRAAEQRGVEDLQAVIDHSSAVMFDSSTIIPSGSGMARLVVFKPIEGKWKQFQVHFSFLQIGRETHSMSFTFHKREEKV
jgi:hypothetical protein